MLEAAGTKWNFLPFRHVSGGHCIGVDPYYLTYKAEVNTPQVILAGRRINEEVAAHVVNEVINMLKKRISILNSRILVLGLALKSAGC